MKMVPLEVMEDFRDKVPEFQPGKQNLPLALRIRPSEKYEGFFISRFQKLAHT